MTTTRRTFITTSLLGTAAGLGGSRLLAADQPQPARPPPLDRELVATMVRVAHFDLAQVTALLAEHPPLANAVWDWGGGDFESPLEAAAHVGNRPIAEHLLVHGARASLFASAMLSARDVVTAAIKATPNLANARGPHGFTLLYHVASSGDIAMAELLQPHLSDPAPQFNQSVHAATRDQRPEMLAWLVEHGATDLNTRDFRGRTPLTAALAAGSTEMIRLLRAHGATE